MFRKFIFATLIAAITLVNMRANAGQDILIALGAHTASGDSPVQYKSTETGIHVIIKFTAVPGVDTVTPSVYGKDYYGNEYPIIQGTAISTTGTTVLKIGPGFGQIANNAAADAIPDVWFVRMTHSAGTSFTYSVTANKEKY